MAPADDSDDAARSDEGLSEASRGASRLSGADERFGFTGVGLVADDAGSELPPGTVLGDVTIVRRIDAGGMGCVYEGRQHAPDRPVAVKVMHRGLLGGGLLRRFAAEAEILARLKHPHIAQIHSFGTHRDPLGPLPFFVMELVADGRPLTRFAADRGLDPRQRVALFEQVCGAVAHGHQRGVVHRDLKPGNILVDAVGEPKVIDFGVARATNADRAGTTTTGSGVVGTLRYMSPEQLGLGGDGVDTRSDVYALGLVLHELLLGDLPYDLGGRSPVAAAALLSGREGTPAADVERGLRARGGLPRREAARLAVVVAACLHVDPARRYGTAVELRAELGRWLAGEPLLVRPPTLVESLGRFATRHRAATAAGVATALAVLAATAGIGWFSLRAERQRRTAEAARVVAEARGVEAERRTADARRELRRSRVLLAAAARERGALAEARRLLDAARDAEPAAARSIEIACVAADLDGAIATLAADGGPVTAVAWSKDGRTLAAGTARGDVRCWRWPADGSARPAWSGRHEGEVWNAAFAPDGARLATASADGTVRLWSTGGVLERTLAGHEGPVYGIAWSPDGRRLATTGRDGSVRLWEAATGDETGRFAAGDGTVFAVAFAPDGVHLATGARDGVVRIRDVGSGSLRGELRGHAGRVFALAYAADGALASASEDGTVRVWDAETDEPRLVLRHPLRVNGVAFTAGGDRLVTAAADGVLRVWDAVDGGETARLVGHEGACWSVAVQPAGTLVASGAADGTARVWDLDPEVAPWRRESERVTAIARVPGRALLAVATADGRVRLRDARTLRDRVLLAEAGGSGVRSLACAPDGGLLAAAADDGGVTLWDLATREVVSRRRPHERRIYAVAFSPSGRQLLTAAEDRAARVTEVASGAAVLPPLRHPRRVLGAAWSPDGTKLATACEDRLVRLWDATTGGLLADWPGHSGPVNWVAFSAEGGRLVSASSDATVRIWDMAGGAPQRVLTGPARQVWKAVFSPDGSRVAAAAADGTVPIWEAADGEPVVTLRGHADGVWAVDFAPDGRSLVTGAADGSVRLWGVSAREIALRETAADDGTPQAASPDAAWDQFRGPRADGSSTADLPLEWGEERNVRWKTPLPGKAWSSPVAAAGRIWLSNATEDGRRLSAVCVDAADGRVLHDVTVFEIAAPAICDPYNSYASPTPVLAEGRLFVHFGSAGTACLDATTGAVLWRRQDLPCDHHRGPGSSPIPWRDRLFVNFDGFDRQYVVALARDDGRTLWKTDRDIDYGSDDGDMKKAYCTPTVVEHAGRFDLVSPAAMATVAYDPETGAERWRVRHGGYNAAARPLVAGGVVVVTTAGGDNVVAIRPGGSGDVTRTHVAWKFKKSAPTRPSQAVVGDHLYLVSDNGVFSCVALADGAVAWQERRSGRHSASPIRSGDRIYWCDEDGTTVVTRANPERFELLAENRLEAGCMASPAVVDGDLVVRTKTHLYRIGADRP